MTNNEIISASSLRVKRNSLSAKMVVLNPASFSFMFFCISSVLCFYLEPASRCIPTTRVRGPCHSCVCTATGIFQCRAEFCRTSNLQGNRTIDRNLKPLCEPNYMYRVKRLFCTCSVEGKWESDRCQETFQYLLPDEAKTAVEKLSIKCVQNAFYLIDCNICRCDRNGYFTCTSRRCKEGHKADVCKYGDYLKVNNQICVCSEINYYIDQLCVDVKPKEIQEINLNDLSKIVLIGPNIRSSIEHGTSCTPHLIYYKDCNRCICIQDGQLLCTNNNCKLMRKDISSVANKIEMSMKNDFLSLPELKKRQKCNPGKKYRLKCNTCYCTPKRKASCTTMICLENVVQPLLNYGKARSSQRSSNEEIPELFEGDNCVPGKVYKVDCNTCRCGYNNALMCTKVACLGDELTLRSRKEKKNVKKKALRTGKTYNLPELPATGCEPGKVYHKGCERCFCNEKKVPLCTVKSCDDKAPIIIGKPEDIRPAVGILDFPALPSLPNAASKCVPGTTYRVNCNSCVCLANGNLLCGTLICLSIPDVNRVEAQKLSNQQCTNKTVPQIECIKCSCNQRVTTCQDIPDCVPTALRRHLHGDVPQGLDMERDHCEKNMIYKLSCNKCYCQGDESLRCTKKGCLSYQLTQKLKKQRITLLKKERITKLKLKVNDKDALKNNELDPVISVIDKGTPDENNDKDDLSSL